MKTLVILVHPSIETSVINKAWAEAVAGHVTIHNLYQTYPPGTPIDIKAEQALVEAHDRIVFQYPLYWYAAPSLLKEWMDTVFTEGWAYGEGGDALTTKEIGAAVSCGGKEAEFAPGGNQRNSLATYLAVYEGISAFARCKYIGFHAVYDTYSADIARRLPANCAQYLEFLTQPAR